MSGHRLPGWLRGCGQKAVIDEDWRTPVMGLQLVVVGPPNQLAVVPLAGADLDSEGEAVLIEASRNTDSGNAQHVHPCGRTVRTIAQMIVLRHCLVHGRHLDSWIDE